MMIFKVLIISFISCLDSGQIKIQIQPKRLLLKEKMVMSLFSQIIISFSLDSRINQQYTFIPHLTTLPNTPTYTQPTLPHTHTLYPTPPQLTLHIPHPCIPPTPPHTPKLHSPTSLYPTTHSPHPHTSTLPHLYTSTPSQPYTPTPPHPYTPTPHTSTLSHLTPHTPTLPHPYTLTPHTPTPIHSNMPHPKKKSPSGIFYWVTSEATACLNVGKKMHMVCCSVQDPK